MNRLTAYFTSCALTLCAPMSATGQTQPCKEPLLRIPVVFEFADVDVREPWVYGSTYPRLLPKGTTEEIAPRVSGFSEGAFQLEFCAAETAIAQGFKLRFGPRSIDIAVRPIDRTTTPPTMATISILKQARPDWLIVRSVKKLEAAGDGLPVFDLELFNFGKPHPGITVALQSSSMLGYSCMASKTPMTVPIVVSAVGSRLKLLSADPDYPEQLITRSARIEVPGCGPPGIFAELGSTSSLPEGPSRIRYQIKRAKVSGPAVERKGRRGFLGPEAGAEASPAPEASSQIGHPITSESLDSMVRNLQFTVSTGYFWTPASRTASGGLPLLFER